MKAVKKISKKADSKSGKSAGFTDEEKSAMKSRIRELKGKAGGDGAVLAAIAKMPPPYRALGERLHALIQTNAPSLEPKTWYGLPAYAKAGKVICYMRMNPKPPFNDRYMIFGFNESANLDEGCLWPVAFALKELTGAEETRIAALVKKAIAE
jgi:uncharacterized protein YdhG (YjbR/CyaY superfamily)